MKNANPSMARSNVELSHCEIPEVSGDVGDFSRFLVGKNVENCFCWVVITEVHAKF
jgi:hypothetical protein